MTLWSLLYPLYKNNNWQGLVTPFKKIVKWLQLLETKQEFQNALSVYPIESGSCYNNITLPVNAKGLCLQSIAAQESSADAATPEEIKNAEKAWQKTVKDLPSPKRCNGVR